MWVMNRVNGVLLFYLKFHILQVCIDNGVKYCETGPELETNDDVQSMWKSFDVRRHKRRRCFIKEI